MGADELKEQYIREIGDELARRGLRVHHRAVLDRAVEPSERRTVGGHERMFSRAFLALDPRTYKAR
jgi:hypothetical protein